MAKKEQIMEWYDWIQWGVIAVLFIWNMCLQDRETIDKCNAKVGEYSTEMRLNSHVDGHDKQIKGYGREFRQIYQRLTDTESNGSQLRHDCEKLRGEIKSNTGAIVNANARIEKANRIQQCATNGHKFIFSRTIPDGFFARMANVEFKCSRCGASYTTPNSFLTEKEAAMVLDIVGYEPVKGGK